MNDSTASKEVAFEFYLTGFGRFAGIDDNPTTHLMHNFPKYLSNNHKFKLPVQTTKTHKTNISVHIQQKNIKIVCNEILHVSGAIGTQQLMKIRNNPNDKLLAQPNPKNIKNVSESKSTLDMNAILSALPKEQQMIEDKTEIKSDSNVNNSSSSKERKVIKIYLHFGVAAGRSKICLETYAFNIANFSVADECGWSPMEESILVSNGGKCVINDRYECKLNINQLLENIQQIRGDSVSNGKYRDLVCKSLDPGKYLCNWIYFLSLYYSQNTEGEQYCMFIHVPLFQDICEKIQCEFARDLIIQIAELF